MGRGSFRAAVGGLRRFFGIDEERSVAEREGRRQGERGEREGEKNEGDEEENGQSC